MITATTTEGLVVRHIYACIYKIYRTRNQYMFIFFSPNPSFYEQFSPKPLGGTKLCRQPCEAENGAEPQWCSLRCEEDISAGRWQWWGTDTGCWSHSKIEAVHLERRPSMLPWMGSRENLHDGWSSRLLEPEQSEEGNGEGMQMLTVMEDWLCIKFTYREDNWS